jgi:hypothetical protein
MRSRMISSGAAAPIAHQGDGDEEGIFAPELVAEIAEQDRAERSEGEADREGRPGEQSGEQFVARREEAALQDA